MCLGQRFVLQVTPNRDFWLFWISNCVYLDFIELKMIAATTYWVFLFSEYIKEIKEIESDDINLMLLTNTDMEEGNIVLVYVIKQ